MSEPYLIAIKSRGQPAFDIAERWPCPMCQGEWDGINPPVRVGDACDECDGEGFWWITNAGFRAHPWWAVILEDVMVDTIGDLSGIKEPREACGEMPSGLPDLFPTNATKTPTRRPADLLRSLGLVPQGPTVKRRI